MKVENAELRIVVGTLETKYEPCVVRLCIHVNADGLGFVALTAHEGRKDVFAFLGQREFDALKELVANTDRTLAELRSDGKLIELRG